MFKKIIEEFVAQWPYFVVIAMLSALIWSLLGQLEVSRANERELGSRAYIYGKTGTNSTYEKK